MLVFKHSMFPAPELGLESLENHGLSKGSMIPCMIYIGAKVPMYRQYPFERPTKSRLVSM